MSRNPDSFDADELLAELGVEIPWPSEQKRAAAVECGQKAPPVRRHTEWSNHESFEFRGYLARVLRTTCLCCGKKQETLEGIFTVEVKVGTGARRMQALSEKAVWPLEDGHSIEVNDASARYCVSCVRDLGFTKEVKGAGTAFDITIR